jgi:hypothetical protein
LERVNFETAQDFIIDPTANRTKQAIFAKDNLEGLLQFINIQIK